MVSMGMDVPLEEGKIGHKKSCTNVRRHQYSNVRIQFFSDYRLFPRTSWTNSSFSCILIPFANFSERKLLCETCFFKIRSVILRLFSKKQQEFLE